MAFSEDRVRVDGKFFSLGGRKWYPTGLTYGPFPHDTDGVALPAQPVACRDLSQMRALGANAIRLYHPPPIWFLDEALNHGHRVLIDIPWDKHRCFLEDWSARVEALARVRQAARTLGSHPAVFAISVANEIPKDIVRFSGTRRVERFIQDLLVAVKNEAPTCLATYTNYPSTEFLHPPGQDFYCLNLYLDEPQILRGYLHRLQHVAGALPLILGEYGLDSLRNGEECQAETLRDHVTEVFRCGLAGSFVFSFTDEWFTGGQLIEDWAFGVTTCERIEKPAAQELARVWRRVPHAAFSSSPRVSVVVCSYNGAATLAECLASLCSLDYEDYEVILIDDGSTDDTPEIASRFPSVRYIRQANHGLSVARNVGARAASAEIVAYTDSDCIADEMWLRYLVSAMLDQGVEAVGGPNVTPTGDNWTAKCVAACPGNPSHVMLDDVHAEHVPGCNMAFRRDRLLAIGGFDPQFRQAGDDVDVCWRFLDRGWNIGYAAAALVWHHRRNTIGAYLKQQKGYGRSEAMLHFKHPQRFNELCCSRWHGVVYGDGAVGLSVATPLIYHGRFGTGLFQIVYRNNHHSLWLYFTLLEWHVVAVLFLVPTIIWPAFLLISAAMWLATLAAALRSTWRAPLEAGAPRWCRLAIFCLYVIQPIVRSYHRYAHRLRNKRIPKAVLERDPGKTPNTKRISAGSRDWYFQSHSNVGREELLESIIEETDRIGWAGDFDSHWRSYDLELVGDVWHKLRLRTATEELGWPNRFTRVRCVLKPTNAALLSAALLLGIAVPLVLGPLPWTAAAPLGVLGTITLMAWRGRRRCWRSIGNLVAEAARACGMEPAPSTSVDPLEVAPGETASRTAAEDPIVANSSESSPTGPQLLDSWRWRFTE